MQTHTATIDRSYNRLVRAPRRIAVTLLAFILTFLASRTALAQDDGTTPDVSASDALPACNVNFGEGTMFGYGLYPKVAVNASGLAVEVEQLDGSIGKISYRIGQVGGSSVTWGDRYEVPIDPFTNLPAYRPSVAITKGGQVIIVWSNSAGRGAGEVLLWYRVGQVDPNGGANQRILWLTLPYTWDAGFNSSIAVNDNGLIVGVHESGTNGTGLYYRIGQFTDPPYSYYIKWTSGQHGIRYTGGVSPNIAINNLNQVIEVHQVQANEMLLHYVRGTISAPYSNIAFAGDQPRYHSNASEPTIALLDSGLVIESQMESGKLGGMVGQLSTTDSIKINWTCSLLFNPPVTNQERPELAAIGNTAILVTVGNPYTNNSRLYSYVSKF